MTVDLSLLQRAIERLDEGLARHRTDPEDAQLRDGLIQRFEFTYDLAHKTLRRVIEARSAGEREIDALSFAGLIRTASEQGLLEMGWPRWRLYRDKRNITSHTYDEEKARDVAAMIPDFLCDVRELARRLSGAEET